MALRVTVPPSSEPLDLDETKTYLRVDNDDEDTLITALITSARGYCEQFQNRAYITQTLELTMDHFPGHSRVFGLFGYESSYRHRRRHHAEIELPRPPIQSVTSVEYIDHTGAVTTLDPSTYIVDMSSEPGRLVPASGQNWPIIHLQPVNSVRVQYVAGYSDDASKVPGTVKQAMQMLVAHWYQNREAVLTGSISKEIEFAVKALLGLDRVMNV